MAIAHALSLPGSTREEYGPHAEVHILHNGLQVVLLEEHSAPVVALQTWVRFGSADEENNDAGIAHVFEHMLFKGTERFPHGEIAALIEGAGGTVNAWTSYDETVYHVTISSRFWETGFDVLSDALLHSLFNPTDLDHEKEVVYEEFRRGKDNPDHELAERLFAMAFTIHPYRRPIIGFEDTFTRITSDDMRRIFRTWYVPNNMTLVAVGDFDTDVLLRAVEARFGAAEARPLPPRPRPEEPLQTAPRLTVFPFRAELARIEIGLPSVAATDPRVPALDLLSDLLGTGYNSALYTALKRRRALAHDVYAFNYTPRDRGIFVLGASCAPECAPEVLRGLMQQIYEPVLALSDHELAAAKTRIVSHFVHARETYQGIADQLGRSALIYGDPNYGTHYIAAVEALTRDDLRQAAAACLDPQRVNIALLVPQEATLPDEAAVLTWCQPEKRHSTHHVPHASTPMPVIDLPGGSTLIVQTDRKAPLVSIRAVLNGGQRAEPPGKEGLVRLLTSVWDMGTSLRSAAEIERDLDRLGASLSASSDRDSLQLGARFLKETFAEGLQLFFEILAEPMFPDAEVERERADQLRDLESLRENRFQFGFQHFLQAFYGAHPYNHLALGLHDGLATVTRADLVAFHRLLLRPDRTVYAVVGDIAVDEVLTLFYHTAPSVLFEAGTLLPSPAPAVPVWSDMSTHVLPIEGQQTHIIWGFPTVTLRDRDRYALRVLDTILGGMGGRLFTELRDQKSLAYTVTSFDAYPVDPGFLALYIGCSPDKEAEALSEFERVVHEVQDAGVTTEELTRAQTYLEGALDIGLQGTSQRTAVYGLGQLHLGKWNAFQDYIEAVRQVSVTDVQRVAQRYLNPARSVRVILRAQR
ncbi:MAG: insulinase family protein [candidate division KSB1 bacterium]|nr:insulinase family protein [candidate division KSB1 bacterium]